MTNSPATMMEFLLPDVISWGISFFLCSNANWNIISWISSLPTFGLQLDHDLSWVSRLPTLGFGISQLPKSLEPVSEIHTHTHTHTHTQTGLLLPFSFMALPFLYIKTLSIMTYYILSSNTTVLKFRFIVNMIERNYKYLKILSKCTCEIIVNVEPIK